MSSKENRDNSTEKNLMTLDQLSQTIDVITGVVNRLKRHLNMQLTLNVPEIEQTVDLNRELLHNERELQDLQQLANQQRDAVLGVESADHETSGDVACTDQDHEDSSAVAEKRRKFIIEISRLNGTDDNDCERVLH